MMAFLHVLPLLPPLIWFVYKFLHHYRIDQFKTLPQMKPDLIWGHMKAVGKYVRKNEAGRKNAHEGMS